MTNILAVDPGHQKCGVAVVNEEGKRIADGASYDLWVGTHGPDQQSCRLTGTDTIQLKVFL